MSPTAPNTDRRLSIVLLYAGTLFTSASLMFVLQPLFGKILLPLLGGSPAVWNTCMVFYQIVVFLGYLYAHILSTRLQPKRQIPIHIVLMLLSFLALPLALSENTVPPTDSNPTFWLLWTLTLAIGLPFFVVSTTAPLMQKWFSQVGHHTSHDPYFLYVASNVGSLLALLSYPFVIEPSLELAEQKAFWALAYGLLCLLISACAFALWKNWDGKEIPNESALGTAESLGWQEKLYWMALAFVPSSLLLGVTNFISTDIASVPLLWIIPLTLYLLSFIIVFSKWNDRLHPLMVKAQAFFLLVFITYAFINPADLPYWAYLALHTMAFFLATMVCHGELAKKRPHTRHLTTYYLFMSFAGMLGGMFNTFVAPFVFNGIYEYPLMIVAALLLRPGWKTHDSEKLLLQCVPPVVLVLIGWALYASIDNLLNYFDYLAVTLILLTILSFFTRKRSVLYALSTGAVIFLAMGMHSLSAHTLFQQRTFFGVLAVRESLLTNEQNQPETYHELFHGTTKHGAERLPKDLSAVPLTYYSRPGPMGQLFKEYDALPAGQLGSKNWTVGVVGLGAGALACYAQKSQDWTLYEIDPLVVDVAKNTQYFNYLSQCAPNAKTVIGDARLSLSKEPGQKFDLLLLDAFSSDAVPTHLLTQEAIQLYFKKLKPNGILAFHMTNRHLLLKKVLSIHAENLHLAALIQEFNPVTEQPLVVATDWVVMAKNPEALQPLVSSQLGEWEKMPLYFDMKPWTDDFTNIVKIWK